MEDVEELTNDDLKDMGVKAYAHRKKIIKGIAAHFSVKSGSNSIQNKQESKQKIDTKTKLPETGVLQWNITGDLLRQFKNAKHKEEFVSPDFKTEDGTIWRVQFYPRGKTSSEQCSVFLLCATLSANKARIGVNYSFNIIDDIWINDSAETFIKDGDTWGKNEAFKSAKLDDLSTLHIQCVVEETMDVADGNEFFEWTISNYMLQKWRNAKQKDKFYSPSFKAIGAEWHFRVIPNGWSTEGIAELDIQCKSIESDEKEMSVCHYADIVSLDYCDIHLKGTTTKASDWFEFKSPFKFDEIQNQSEMTFCLKSWKQDCIDKVETQSLSNLYANKKKSPEEWRKYFITETNPIAALLFRLEVSQYASIFKENGYDTIQQLQGLTSMDLSNIGVDVDAHGQAILNGIAAHLNRVTTFLSHLGFDRYTPIFKENECETMDDLEELTNDDLKDMGVKAYAHRKKILKAVTAHFTAQPNLKPKQNDVEIQPKRNLPETGVLEWEITGDLLRQFKNAKHEQEFISPDFKTADGTKWRVQFYPRGKTSSEKCSIFLLCATLSGNKERIGVNYSFDVMNGVWTNESAEIFVSDGDTWGKGEAFEVDKLDNVKSVLKIQCVVEETMDVTEGNEFFEWTVSNYMLQKWRNAKQKDKFYSPSFKAIGAEWRLRVIPNGWTTEGIAEVDLQCKSIESDEKEINVCHYADIVTLDYCQIHLKGTTAKASDWFEFNSPFKLNDIENESAMTFCIKSWRQECIDKEEVQSLSHLYAKKKKSPKEWREYFITETNRVAKLLFRLELAQYAATFKANGYDTIHQLQGLTVADLSNLGVDVGAHGKTIINGFAAHLNRVTTFLSHLGFDQYTPIFKQNECETMEDIEELTNDDLKDMGIKAYAHRKKIVKGIAAHFIIKPHIKPVIAVQIQEESKEDDVAIYDTPHRHLKPFISHTTTVIANSRNNGLIVCVGIAKYAHPLDDLDTANDIARYRSLFEDLYNYKVIANDPSQPMKPKDLQKFLGIARGQHLYDFGSL
eukprot:153620_1